MILHVRLIKSPYLNRMTAYLAELRCVSSHEHQGANQPSKKLLALLPN